MLTCTPPAPGDTAAAWQLLVWGTPELRHHPGSPNRASATCSCGTAAHLHQEPAAGWLGRGAFLRGGSRGPQLRPEVRERGSRNLMRFSQDTHYKAVPSPPTAWSPPGSPSLSQSLGNGGLILLPHTGRQQDLLRPPKPSPESAHPALLLTCSMVLGGPVVPRWGATPAGAQGPRPRW